jgi:CRP-like cAMP-binding protein
MYTAIDTAVAASITLNEEERRLFHKLLKYRKLRKRAYLLQEGDICTFEAFIIKGCVRAFYSETGGIETNLSFAIEGDWVTDLQSVSTQTPSTTSIETLEETELLLLDYPSIAQRITQTQIARFIGVSPEFLSKMRSLMYRRVS